MRATGASFHALKHTRNRLRIVRSRAGRTGTRAGLNASHRNNAGTVTNRIRHLIGLTTAAGSTRQRIISTDRPTSITRKSGLLIDRAAIRPSALTIGQRPRRIRAALTLTINRRRTIGAVRRRNNSATVELTAVCVATVLAVVWPIKRVIRASHISANSLAGSLRRIEITTTRVHGRIPFERCIDENGRDSFAEGHRRKHEKKKRNDYSHRRPPTVRPSTTTGQSTSTLRGRVGEDGNENGTESRGTGRTG